VNYLGNGSTMLLKFQPGNSKELTINITKHGVRAVHVCDTWLLFSQFRLPARYSCRELAKLQMKRLFLNPNKFNTVHVSLNKLLAT
jgi:hypothetical protein